MKIKMLIAIALLTGCCCLDPATKTITHQNNSYRSDFLIAGYLEKVTVAGGSIQGNAKLDTGADNCSITAKNIVEFEKDGEQWVRFDVVIDEKTTNLKRKVVRIANIKRHGAEDQLRFVVMLDMKLGSINEEVQFSLTDRSHYSVPILVGRNYLNGNVIVDPSQKFIVKEK